MTATLPTTRPTTSDEDWRYADADFLAASHPVSLSHWRTADVPAGKTKFEYLSHFGGPQSAGSVDRLRVHVGQGGRFDAFYLLGGGGYHRMELEVTLEEGAHFEFGGATVGGGDARQEFVTRVIHAKPNGTSNQVVRAVQAGASTGNFLGRIEVARDAQKTDAAQNFRAILLERGASANAKPELEIFADDVKCAHGAAIGALDEAAAFYMAARGVAPDVARQLLIQAFLGDAFAALPEAKIREKMLAKALDALNETTP